MGDTIANAYAAGNDPVERENWKMQNREKLLEPDAWEGKGRWQPKSQEGRQSTQRGMQSLCRRGNGKSASSLPLLEVEWERRGVRFQEEKLLDHHGGKIHCLLPSVLNLEKLSYFKDLRLSVNCLMKSVLMCLYFIPDLYHEITEVMNIPYVSVLNCRVESYLV